MAGRRGWRTDWCTFTLQKICLINNYDAILAVFEERGVSKSDDQVLIIGIRVR